MGSKPGSDRAVGEPAESAGSLCCLQISAPLHWQAQDVGDRGWEGVHRVPGCWADTQGGLRQLVRE